MKKLLIEARSTSARVACVLGMLSVCSGCTMGLWRDDGWWPLRRVHAEKITCCNVDDDGQMDVQVAMDDGGTLWLRAVNPTWQVIGSLAVWERSDAKEMVEWKGVVTEKAQRRATIIGIGEMRDKIIARDGDGKQLLVALEPADGPYLDTIVSVEIDGVVRGVRCTLPDPRVDYLSMNMMGHVAITPITVVADIALLPLIALGCGLQAIGLGH